MFLLLNTIFRTCIQQNSNYENRNKCITIYIFITDRCKHTVVCIKFKKKKINKFSTQVEKCIPMGISEHNCQSSDHPPKEHHSKTVYIKPNHFHLKHWNTCSSLI